MKDVCQLKIERGDEDVIVKANANANADGKANEDGTKVGIRHTISASLKPLSATHR
jgi:hypothetical protein